LVGGGEVVAGGRCVGVVTAEHPLSIRQRPLIQRDRPPKSPADS
jgi:hypothetical protein